MTYLPGQGDPHNPDCRICKGARTCLFVEITIGGKPGVMCLHACMRCDTDTGGGGFGPPVFVKEWNERSRSGSEEK